MFILVYSNQDDHAKIYEDQRYYLPKGIAKNYNVIMNRNNFYYQPTDSDAKRYKGNMKVNNRLR